MPKNTGVLKVAVFADGRLTLNGKVSSIENLQETIYAFRKSNGTIWYYSEPCRKAPRIATEALLSLSSSGIPIQFAGKPDFSDRV